MRTVQKTYTLFIISELEDTARQKAYTDWLAKGNSYPYAFENSSTLEVFCNLFRIVCTNYFSDSCTYYYRFHTEQEKDTEELSDIRLRTFICNNFHYGLYHPKTYWTKDLKNKRKSRISLISSCPLTGFIMDDIMLKPHVDFMRSPNIRNFKDSCVIVWKPFSVHVVMIASIARARNISRTRATALIGSI